MSEGLGMKGRRCVCLAVFVDFQNSDIFSSLTDYTFKRLNENEANVSISDVSLYLSVIFPSSCVHLVAWKVPHSSMITIDISLFSIYYPQENRYHHKHLGKPGVTAHNPMSW